MMQSPLSSIPGSEVFAAGVVRELPAEIALPAWQVLRWVVLWADEGRGSTAGLLDPARLEEAAKDFAGDRPFAAGEDPRVPLVAVAIELMQPEPDGERIARACICMTEWALPRQHMATALAFAEAAAFAMPCSRWTILAAKLHRQLGAYLDADRLFKVAEKLAREEKDWEANVRVRLARGAADVMHGQYDQAKAEMLKALQTCERHRLTGAVLAEVYHDLLTAEAGLKDYTAAVSHAEVAMRTYARDSPRLPYLTHDLAGMWMELGDYENALRVLRSLLARHFLSDPLSRMMVCASAVRAAAGCGDDATYARLAAELDTLIGRAGQVTVRHGPALVAAARGAAMASDVPRLERWAKLSAAWGEQMQQDDVVAEARSVAHRPAPPATARSRVRRNQELAEKAVAVLADSAAA